MNSIQINRPLSTPTATTMTSREVAELTGKEHKNVMADIRVMLEQLELTSAEFSANLPDSYGRPQPGFKLPKDLTLTLVAGYSAPLRHRIVTRWLELEAAAPAIPQTFAAALRLAADTQERLEASQALAAQFQAHLAVAAPKALALDVMVHDSRRTIEAVIRDGSAFHGIKTTGIKAQSAAINPGLSNS